MSADKLKILYAVHGYKPAHRVGGPIVSVAALAERLARRGHHVTVATTDGNLNTRLDIPVNRPVDVHGVEVWYFRATTMTHHYLRFLYRKDHITGFVYAPEMAKRAATFVRAADVVHTHLPFIYPTLVIGRAAIRAQTPLFYHQRGVFDPSRLRYRSLKKRLYVEVFERPILERVTTFIALTEAEVNSYRRLGLTGPCRVITNGIDVMPLVVDARGVAQARWRIPQSARVVLFLGRLHELKGVRELVTAFNEVRRVLPDALLVIAGPSEGDEHEKLAARVAELKLRDSVKFLGVVTGEDKRTLLCRADVCCLPSVAEGFSMTVLESLASARPVVISPGCHFPEVEERGAGMIVSRDPSSVSVALVRLLSDRTRMDEMGRRGRQLVTDKYSWDRIVDATLDAYEEGLWRAGRPSPATPTRRNDRQETVA